MSNEEQTDHLKEIVLLALCREIARLEKAEAAIQRYLRELREILADMEDETPD